MMMKTVTLFTSPNPVFRSRSRTTTVLRHSHSHSHSHSFVLQCSSQRNLSEQHMPTRKEQFGKLKQRAWHKPNMLKCRLFSEEVQHEAAQPGDEIYETGSSYLSISNSRTVCDSGASANTLALDELVHLSKFVFLFGSLTFLGAPEACAASQFIDSLKSASFFGDLGDISSGFASAFLLIFFSELGDKTFFIAALLAARNSPAVVFTGTFGALGIMTIISVVLGRTFHYIDGILPFSFGGSDLPIDDIAAVCLLLYFGITTLIEASSSDSQKAEDEQKEAELAVSDFAGNGAGILAAASTVISTFILVFVAEWGDKSFFSTIALAAASSPLGVIGGALAGHGIATLLAVAGGSLLGNFLSEKVIAYTGGVLFLVFAGITLVEIISG